MRTLTTDQTQEIRTANGTPTRCIDPETRDEYVVLPAEMFERLQSLLSDEPLTDRERQFHLREFGRRAGWDDPEMDVYNDLDPRRTT